MALIPGRAPLGLPPSGGGGPPMGAPPGGGGGISGLLASLAASHGAPASLTMHPGGGGGGPPMGGGMPPMGGGGGGPRPCRPSLAAAGLLRCRRWARARRAADPSHGRAASAYRTPARTSRAAASEGSGRQAAGQRWKPDQILAGSGVVVVNRSWLHPAAGSETGHGFVQVYEQMELLLARVAKIEARLYAAPIVVDETAYYPDADLAVGVTVRTMSAANLPTGWEIVSEYRDELPTTNYWLIDANGAVSPTEAGVAGIKKHNTVEILVRASNEFGFGDGKLEIRFT